MWVKKSSDRQETLGLFQSMAVCLERTAIHISPQYWSGVCMYLFYLSYL